MKSRRKLFGFCLTVLQIVFAGESLTHAGEKTARHFTARDVFELEYASDPQISPDGKRIVYVRNAADIMTDKFRSRLWIINSDGTNHRPLTAWEQNAKNPEWSPDGKQLAYIAKTEQGAEIFLRYLDTGETARLSNVTETPFGLSFSPDGKRLAFSMRVRKKKKPIVELPEKPEGAKWADPPKEIDQLVYRVDGNGYVKEGFSHLFVLPTEGGTPRQVTTGDFHHSQTPVWTADSQSLIFSANRHPQWEYEPMRSDLYELNVANGALKRLTDRKGPDESPALSRDGKHIAYIGFDDTGHSYHQTDLYVMNRDGTGAKCLTKTFDRAVSSPNFNGDGTSILFQYDDQGVTKVASVSMDQADVTPLVDNVGGVTIGRPYASGSYSISKNGVLAFTKTSPKRPADLAVFKNNAVQQLTRLNDDLLGHKELGALEKLAFQSNHDGLAISGWILTPPGFDKKKKYPLILEIHGGPFANYGERFSAEMQLYAAAGYVVVYLNPRGSTSYGLEFAHKIDKNYPSEDYDDLMTGIDKMLEKPFVDPDRLYVTGGSGGGVLSSWIVGKTNRFRAAVVAKPVINWYSFVLTSDYTNYFARYWFGKFPWDDPESYLKRSPLSLVGNVKTPTMLLTGEADYRTPISESEQFYQALKLRKIDTMLVRVPDASHGIAARPSHLIAKVAYILKWFETH